MENKNKIYKFTENINAMLTKKLDLMQFIETEIINDNEFLNLIDKTISPSKHKSIDKTKKELYDDFVYYTHNGTRSYILKIIVLKFIANKMCENFSVLSSDPYWQELVNKLKGNIF